MTPVKRYRTIQQVSSGGVIMRTLQGHPQVCLISRHRAGQAIWGLPKGHLESGEVFEQTAVREVYEETGLRGECLAALGSIAYQFIVKEEHARYLKTVHFYLLRYLEGEPHPHDREVDEAVWLPLDEALTRISYENERQVLLQAQRYLNDTTTTTSKPSVHSP